MSRKLDDLGRIVLPVEMRRMFGIRAGDELEISVEDDGIVLRKRVAGCVFCGATDDLRRHRGKAVCERCWQEVSSSQVPGGERRADSGSGAEDRESGVVDPPSGHA